MSVVSPPKTDADARVKFLAQLAECFAAGQWVKLVLARHVGAEEELERVTVKPLVLKGELRLSFLYRYKTRDITKHHPGDVALEEISNLLPASFRNAHFQSAAQELQLEFSKKGKAMLHSRRLKAEVPAVAASHDRAKHRYLELQRPFLQALGVTDSQHQLIPAMSRKWKQINKFIEVFSHALATSPLAEQAKVQVADFGSGKGYLTFAIHDYLSHSLGREAEVTGVELREDMVQLCNTAAQGLQLSGLHFEHGDVRSVVPSSIDVMIALHACDIATDYAIHTGIRCGAAIIMCSPCCHKQLRPQMKSPATLKPMLQYGLHMGQQAEMLTDSLRALYLEACGYETKVFEFVSLEHTSKNKMILAVKRAHPIETPDAAGQIETLKTFYGVQEHCLETLLKNDKLL